MLTGLKKKILSDKTFTGQVVILSFGTAAAQAVPLLLTPLLTRLYTPPEFGLLALFISISAVAVIPAAGKYEIAVVVPPHNRNAINLLSLALLMATGTFLVWIIIFFLFNTQIANLLNNPDLAFWLYLMPASIFALILFEIFYNWLNRLADYKRLSYGKMFHSGSSTSIQVVLGLLGLGAGGLIIGDLAGRICGATYYGWKSITNKVFDWNSIHTEEIKKQASTHKNFPKFTMGSALLTRMAEESPILIITNLFEAAFVGFFAIATRVLKIPMAFLGQAITRVFYRKISENYNQQIESRHLMVKMWVILTVIGLPPTLIIFFWGGSLFQFMLGPQWYEAGVMAAYLTPMVLAEFISTPTSMGYIVYKRQDLSPWFGASSLIYRPLSLYIGFLRDDIYLGIILMVVSHIIQIIVYNIILYRIIKDREDTYG
ncbi:MAG: oligosaccharide flippase family protein [Balneolales bacterium]